MPAMNRSMLPKVGECVRRTAMGVLRATQRNGGCGNASDVYQPVLSSKRQHEWKQQAELSRVLHFWLIHTS